MNNRIVILGGGESGTGAAVLARKKGFEVFVSDKGKIKKKYKDVLSNFDIRFEEGRHSMDVLLEAKEIIKSPGIPEQIPVLEKIRERHIPVISEIEFAGRYTGAKKICITGSNGKTTTTLLTGHILKKAGLDVAVGGNVGNSLAWILAERDPEYLVLEISSFQLDGMFDFKAEIAVLMNITPDHLDRYEHSFDKYARSKLQIARNQKPRDAFIYCLDDANITGRLGELPGKAARYPFSQKKSDFGDGAFLRKTGSGKENELEININDDMMVMTLQELALSGKHNVYNSMAAGVASRLLDIRKDIIKQSFSDFQGVEHRLEFVAMVRGIEFVNDSKATNINSSWYALENASKPVIWIAGGQDKGNDYSSLTPLVEEKVKAIICLGIDNTKIVKAFSKHVGIVIETQSAMDAVRMAYKMGNKGDTVLLSPACASFDLFDNYEDRGNQFKQAVLEL